MKKITMLISAVVLMLTITFGAEVSTDNTEVVAKTSDNTVQMMYDPTVGGVG